jgi:predicted DNA-binding transcriptional regulator AlpA
MDLLNTKAAAQRVGLSPVTLNRYRLTGEGPQFARLGKAVRYRLCDLDAWVSARLVRSTSQEAA